MKGEPETARPIRVQQLIARLNIGGPAVLVLDLAATLNQRGLDVRVAAGQVGPGEAQMDHWADRRGVVWRPVDGLSPRLGRGNGRAWREMRRLVGDGVEVVHTHTAKAGTLGRLAALSLGRRRPKLVHTFHGHVFSGYFPAWKTRLFVAIERFLARRTEVVVVLSPEQADDICDVYRVCDRDRVRIIPIGLDLEPFINAQPGGLRPDLGLGPDVFLVGLIGRLTAIKNQSLAIEALALAAGRDPGADIHLALIGDGEDEAALKTLAAARGVADRVHFTGWQKDMPGVYAGLDGVILTSDNEGLPLALVEALAAGKPVAATPVGGVPTLLGLEGRPSPGGYATAGRGLVCAKGDAAGLAAALRTMAARDPESLERAQRGREYVLNRHSHQAFAFAHENLYRELAGR